MAAAYAWKDMDIRRAARVRRSVDGDPRLHRRLLFDPGMDRRASGSLAPDEQPSQHPRRLEHWIRQALSGRLSYPVLDRKSTRLNSSHVSMSYAVFCLKKTTCRYYLICAVVTRS